MERRRLSKPQQGGLSRAQHKALQDRKKRIAELKAKRGAAERANASVEFKAEPVKRVERKPSQHNPMSNIYTSRPGKYQRAVTHGFEIRTPNRLHRALQVQTGADPVWGNVKSFVINPHTSHDMIDKLDKELRLAMMGWVNNGYFGPDAKFRIASVPAPGSRTAY